MVLTNKLIGTKISEARKKMKLSQAELAEKVFISAQAVGKWERGESMPDIVTLNRLALILGVDLNYFTADFLSKEVEPMAIEKEPVQTSKTNTWDMSRSEWRAADFSGLSNLSERFSGADINDCKFVGSNLSGIQFKRNDVSNCDFSKSNMAKSIIQSSDFPNNQFVECSFVEASFLRCDIKKCDFTKADFTNAKFTHCDISKAVLTGAKWNGTEFNGVQLSNAFINSDIVDCSFLNCSFSNLLIENASLVNTFFKGTNLKRVTFVSCKADKLTYAFLQNGKADLTEVKLIEA